MNLRSQIADKADAKPIALTHFFTFFNKLGGVESFLKGHLANDPAFGIHSQVFAMFDAASVGAGGPMAGLGLTWRDSVRSARRKFSAAMQAWNSGVAVYHNFWGIPFLCDLDRAAVRLALLHTDRPGLGQYLSWQDGLVDGVMCVNEQLRVDVLEHMPSLTPDRVEVLFSPVATPPVSANHLPLGKRPFVCGFSGRLSREQKRLDRLPELCRVLDAAGIDYRFEVLGDGPMRRQLTRVFAGDGRMKVLGRRTGEDYWRTLAGWDAIVFLSDFEGLSIALLEAMSLGVLPIYPRIRSGGDGYVKRVLPDLHYPPGDFEFVARTVRSLQRMPDPEVQHLREKCRELVVPHQGQRYYNQFSSYIHRALEWPRIAPSSFKSRPFFWSDYVPFAFLRRFYERGFGARSG